MSSKRAVIRLVAGGLTIATLSGAFWVIGSLFLRFGGGRLTTPPPGGPVWLDKIAYGVLAVVGLVALVAVILSSVGIIVGVLWGIGGFVIDVIKDRFGGLA